MSYQFIPMSEEAYLAIPEDARPHRVQDSTGVVAVDKDGNFGAIAMMDSWSANSCKIHVTVFNPFVFKHGFAEEVFDFIFNKAGRGVVIGSTPADNKKALKFNEHMGFREIARIQDGFESGVDYVITEMRREDCHWIDQPQLAVGEN